MPKVHKQVARKDYPADGVKKGDTYFSWSLRPGGPYSKGRTYRSATYPSPRQLTSNPFRLGLIDIEESLGAVSISENLDEEPDNLRGQIEAVAEDIRSLGDEQREKFDNMPEGLQQGDTGQLLETRADELESWADELESAVDSLDREDDESDDDYRERLEAALDEAQNTSYGGE